MGVFMGDRYGTPQRDRSEQRKLVNKRHSKTKQLPLLSYALLLFGEGRRKKFPGNCPYRIYIPPMWNNCRGRNKRVMTAITISEGREKRYLARKIRLSSAKCFVFYRGILSLRDNPNLSRLCRWFTGCDERLGTLVGLLLFCSPAMVRFW